MLNFCLGVIVGLLLALIALIAGKRIESFIDDPSISRTPFAKKQMAQVISRTDAIEATING